MSRTSLRCAYACAAAWALTLAMLAPARAAAQPRAGVAGPAVQDLVPAEAYPFVDKSQRSAAQRKMSSDLRALSGAIVGRGPDKASVLRSGPSALSNPFRKVDDAGLIQCYVEYRNDPDAVAAAIQKIGGRVELVRREMGLVQCRLPYDRVESLAADGAVEQIRLPGYAVTKTGSRNSEGDAVHRCNTVRSTYGFTGAGIKVGVISDGIDGISLSQASGDIPASYQAQSARADGDLNAGAEGLAMMEIVYDLAPGAGLAFSNPGTAAEMVSAINILDSTFGCDVICDDIGWADEPFFQDGPIVTRIDQAAGNGAIYVSAAGNAADQNYHESDYSGITKTIGGVSMNVQNFGGGDWHIQTLVPGNGGYVVVVLQWNDPWGGSGNDYDLLLTNSSGSVIYAASESIQNGNDNGVEYTGVVNNGGSSAYVYAVVRKYSGANRHLKMVSWGYGYFTERYTAAGSIWGHPAATSAIAAGAVRWSTPSTIEPFSSRGPVRIDFPTLVSRNKPDLCGADGVSVTGNGGFVSTFYGTSAATPHLAAVCAQVWSARPSASNATIRNLVQSTAVDLGSAGWDSTYGYGRADALNAINAMDLTPPTVISENPGRGSTVASLASVQVTFSEAVTVVAAGNLTINGSPATGVTGSGGGPYAFTGYGPPGDGTVQVALAAGAIQDVQGNPFAGDSWAYMLASADCNGNGIPDACDLDCGEPGGPCDVPGCGRSGDCNNNGVPDECDISEGTSQDQNGDGIPDECPVVLAWRSVREHGNGQGLLPIELGAAGTGTGVTCEPRRFGVQRIEVDLNADVSGLLSGGVEAEDVTHGGTIGATGQYTINGGMTLVIEFVFTNLPPLPEIAGLPDGACYRIDLAGHIPALSGDTDCEFRVLAGDLNGNQAPYGDGQTDLTDMAQVKSMNGSPLRDGSGLIVGNVRFDVNIDGKIDLTDMALVKSLNGNGPVTCP